MQLGKKITWTIALMALMTVSLSSFAAEPAKKGKAYTEEEFLNTFSGKSRKVVLEKLGAPSKKEQSVKPTNASEMIAGKGQESSKPVNVEMWYYNGVVNYAPKKLYKFTELTFVNDRCMNIAFFNNK